MSVIYNSTGIFGQVIEGLTVDITGSLFMSLLMLTILLVAILLAFRVPLEFQAVLIAPLLFTLMAYSQEFLAIGGVLAIFMGIIFARMLAK